MRDRLTRFLAIPFSVRLAWTLWLVLVAAVGVRVAVSKPTSQTVLPIYLAAGERWLSGESLYGPTQTLDVYRNPPVVAAGFAALTQLPEKVAGLLVRGVGVALFLTGLWRVRRTLLPEWGPSRVGWLFALAVVPAVPSVNNGQLNLHLAALALHGVASAARGHWSASAAWVGLAVWVKVYPLSLGLLVTLVAPPRYAVALLAVVLLGALLPFALDDLATARTQYAEYVQSLRLDDRTHDDLSRVPRDWTAIPRTWLGWVSPGPLTKAVSLAVAAGLALLTLVRRGRPLGESLLAALVGSHVWMTAFGPATEMNTYSLLAAVAPLVVLTPGLSRSARVVAVAGYALLVATVLRGMFPNDRDFNVLGPQALGAVLLATAYLSTAPPQASLVSRPRERREQVPVDNAGG